LPLVREVRLKGVRDIVTDADVAAQAIIVKVIRQQFPDHGFLAEEEGAGNQAGEWVWIIDPLDGTVNYARGLPWFAVSVALAHCGHVVAGVVWNPLRQDLYAAASGAGALLNGQSIHVSSRAPLAQAIIGLDWARNPTVRAQVLSALNRLAPAVGTVRAIGSAALALCYVATGQLDAYFHLALQPWDGAAAGLLVREAGGQVTNLSGAEWEYAMPACAASNGLLQTALLELLNGPAAQPAEEQRL
jgi:myo-inositol-1(or 4)-monophosphatase